MRSLGVSWKIAALRSKRRSSYLAMLDHIEDWVDSREQRQSTNAVRHESCNLTAENGANSGQAATFLQQRTGLDRFRYRAAHGESVTDTNLHGD
jgi:hypothetical protein